MAEVLYYAIPFFVLLLVLEYLSFRQVRDENEGLIGYDARDTRTSLTMGLGTSSSISAGSSSSSPPTWRSMS